MARVTEAITNYNQDPHVSFTAGWLSHEISPFSGPQATKCLLQAQEGQGPEETSLCLIRLSACLPPRLHLVLHGWGPAWLLQRESMKTNERRKDYVPPRQTLVKLWSDYLRLGREQAFPQSVSQSLAELCWALLLKDQVGLAFSPGFRGWMFLLYGCQLGSYCNASKCCLLIRFPLHMCSPALWQVGYYMHLPSKGISPAALIPFSVKPANDLWPILPDRLRVYVSLVRVLSPGEPVNALTP